MSELNKELIQSSLFYFNRFFAETLLRLWPKVTLFLPRKSFFMLLLLINPIPFCMQNFFKRAFVSAMGLFNFFFTFSNNNWRKSKICWWRICWYFFQDFLSIVQQIHIIGQIIGSNMNDQIFAFIFNEVIKFFYNFITRATMKFSYLCIVSSVQTILRNSI